MAHDNDASTDTSTSTKSHVKPPNNHQHDKCNTVIDDTPESCDRRHIIAIHVPKTNMLLKCYI